MAGGAAGRARARTAGVGDDAVDAPARRLARETRARERARRAGWRSSPVRAAASARAARSSSARPVRPSTSPARSVQRGRPPAARHRSVPPREEVDALGRHRRRGRARPPRRRCRRGAVRPCARRARSPRRPRQQRVHRHQRAHVGPAVLGGADLELGRHDRRRHPLRLRRQRVRGADDGRRRRRTHRQHQLVGRRGVRVAGGVRRGQVRARPHHRRHRARVGAARRVGGVDLARVRAHRAHRPGRRRRVAPRVARPRAPPSRPVSSAGRWWRSPPIPRSPAGPAAPCPPATWPTSTASPTSTAGSPPAPSATAPSDRRPRPGCVAGTSSRVRTTQPRQRVAVSEWCRSRLSPPAPRALRR